MYEHFITIIVPYLSHIKGNFGMFSFHPYNSFICLSVCLSIYQSIHLSVCLSVYVCPSVSFLCF